MKRQFERWQWVRATLVAQSVLALAGCIVNPTPNAGQFHMSDAETKAAQYNALQTQMMDREAAKAKLRDEAEVRAWEKNITRPQTTVIVPSRY